MAKGEFFYTWKWLSDEPVKYSCTKWESLSGEPVDTYTIYPLDGTNRACSCQAYKRECKHLRELEEARYSGKWKELWKWRWDDKVGWAPLADDMKEDF